MALSHQGMCICIVMHSKMLNFFCYHNKMWLFYCVNWNASVWMDPGNVFQALFHLLGAHLFVFNTFLLYKWHIELGNHLHVRIVSWMKEKSETVEAWEPALAEPLFVPRAELYLLMGKSSPLPDLLHSIKNIMLKMSSLMQSLFPFG